MPEISRFYGIAITMNYREHNPPHFHATYQEQLLEDWNLAQDRKVLLKIPPLA